jgi:hypothetical protein
MQYQTQFNHMAGYKHHMHLLSTCYVHGVYIFRTLWKKKHFYLNSISLIIYSENPQAKREKKYPYSE